MKTGDIYGSPKMKWYEKDHWILGDGTYHQHSWGAIYILSRDAAEWVCRNKASLRKFTNDDVTIGAWMMAADAMYVDNRMLCAENCNHRSAIAVWSFACQGVCDSDQAGMSAVHQQCAMRR